MTEDDRTTDPSSPTDPDTGLVDRHRYSRAALARLALSAELRDLAEQATAGVATTTDAFATPGGFVSDAVDLVDRAQKVLLRAVILEKQKHTSWEEIGRQLGGITKQSANERYRRVWEEWKLSLVDPYYPARPGATFRASRLPEAALHPTSTGEALDLWVRVHEPHRREEHPVTARLPALTVPEELVQVLDAIKHLKETDASPDQRAAVYERKAALLERIAVEEGRPEAHEQAADARARAEQLRRQAQPDT